MLVFRGVRAKELSLLFRCNALFWYGKKAARKIYRFLKANDETKDYDGESCRGRISGEASHISSNIVPL